MTGLRKRWVRFWMRRAGLSLFGRFATWLAALFAPPYYGLVALSRMSPAGFVSPSATLHHPALTLGKRCCVGEGVLIYQDGDGGSVKLGDGVHLHRDSILQTGKGGSIDIGAGTHIQPRCQLSAYEGDIRIGERVEIAPGCAFYPYDHDVQPAIPVREQPVVSRGGIQVGNDVWLGYGVVVLDGVTIGDHAVIGAGAVVTKDIPENAIAAGVPARVVKSRNDLATGKAVS